VGCKVCERSAPVSTVIVRSDTGKVTRRECERCGGHQAAPRPARPVRSPHIDADLDRPPWNGMKQWADKLGNQPHA